MGQTLTLFDAVLKEDYGPAIIEALPKKVELWDEFSKEEEGFDGKRWVVDWNVLRSVGVGARRDGGNMPIAGNQTHVDQYVTPKFNYGRIQVTGPTIAASKSNKGAFAKAVASEIKGITRDLYNQLDRQMSGDGTGEIARIETSATSATMELKYAGASSGAISGEPGTRWLQAGDLVLIGTAAQHSGATADAFTVSSITDRDTVVMTTSASAISAADIVTFGSAAALASTSYNAEIEGLLCPVTNRAGTYQNIALSTYTKAAIQYLDAAAAGGTAGVNRKLTWDLLQQAIDEANVYGSINLLVADTSMRREILDLAKNDVRYIGGKNLDAGYTGDLTFNGIRIKFCRNFKYNAIMGIDKETWTLFTQGGGLNWMDDDGAILSRVSGGDAQEALLRTYCNLSCNLPAANFYLCDISATLRAT